MEEDAQLGKHFLWAALKYVRSVAADLNAGLSSHRAQG